MVGFIDDQRGGARGRADLQGSADRPVHLLRSPGEACRSGPRLSDRARCDAVLRPEIARVFEEELAGLRRSARSGVSWIGKASMSPVAQLPG